MKIDRKRSVLSCPICGAEYLPEEIFYKSDMYGNPKNIIKDENGKILSFSGHTASFNEVYCCDRCGNTFRAMGKIDFRADVCVEDSFDDEYVSSIKFEKYLGV